jgi:hypothetical protein
MVGARCHPGRRPDRHWLTLFHQAKGGRPRAHVSFQGAEAIAGEVKLTETAFPESGALGYPRVVSRREFRRLVGMSFLRRCLGRDRIRQNESRLGGHVSSYGDAPSFMAATTPFGFPEH